MRRDPMTVLVVYGDPVVGQTLALLLRGSTYRVKPVDQSLLTGPDGRFYLLEEEVDLLVFTLDLDAGCSESVLRWVRSIPEMADVPAMALGAPSRGAQLGADYLIPWPIRTEELRRQIEAVLAATGDHLTGNSPVPE